MKKVASAGNRTRAARVAGEHSTTEPLMLGEDAGLAACYGFLEKLVPFVFYHFGRKQTQHTYFAQICCCCSLTNTLFKEDDNARQSPATPPPTNKCLPCN